MDNDAYRNCIFITLRAAAHSDMNALLWVGMCYMSGEGQKNEDTDKVENESGETDLIAAATIAGKQFSSDSILHQATHGDEIIISSNQENEPFLVHTQSHANHHSHSHIPKYTNCHSITESSSICSKRSSSNSLNDCSSNSDEIPRSAAGQHNDDGHFLSEIWNSYKALHSKLDHADVDSGHSVDGIRPYAALQYLTRAAAAGNHKAYFYLATLYRYCFKVGSRHRIVQNNMIILYEIKHNCNLESIYSYSSHCITSSSYHTIQIGLKREMFEENIEES